MRQRLTRLRQHTVLRPRCSPLSGGRVIHVVLPFTILLVVMKCYPSSVQTALRRKVAQTTLARLELLSESSSSSSSMQQGVGERVSMNATRITTMGQTTNVILNTSLGNIRILLHPEWAPESTNYVSSLAQTPCEHCFMHAAIRPEGSKETAFAGVIQGRLWSTTTSAANHLAIPPLPRGRCSTTNHHQIDETTPPGIVIGASSTALDCFGPIMKKGYVAWAAGRTGPDFFINTFERPVPWWGNVHTVWGQVPLDDASSWTVLRELYQLPTVLRRRRFFRGNGAGDEASVLRDDFYFTVSVA